MHHLKLFKNLKDNGVCPFYIRLILIMCSLNNAAVKWNNVETDKFYLKNDVKQGGILNPFLLAIYIDPLLKNLQKSKIGVFDGIIPYYVLSYADNIPSNN